MKKTILAFTVLAAAALTVSGCARQTDDANATVLNEAVTNDAGSADGNFADTGAPDQNAADSNIADAVGNAQ
jgi:uncharacterized lipoprotein NlpE involved in copper resistance